MAEDYTLAYKLFHTYFTCRIPAAYANEQKSKMVGNIEYDTQSKAELAAGEMVLRQYTIPELAVFSRKGARIIIEDPATQSVKMYGLLRDYLHEVKYNIRHSLNHGTIPMNDLKTLDNFAGYLYQVARQYEKLDERGSKTERGLNDLMSNRGFRRSTVSKDDAGKPRKLVPEKVREHRSITDEISHDVLENGFRYK